MSTSTIYALSLGLSLGLSLVAICVAWFVHWRHDRSHQHRRMLGRIGSLELGQAMMDDEMAKLVKLVQRRANREAVAAHRARKEAAAEASKETGPDTESDRDWVKRKNQELILKR